MTLDRPLLAEKAAAIERHLARVAARLPADVADFQPSGARSVSRNPTLSLDVLSGGLRESGVVETALD